MHPLFVHRLLSYPLQTHGFHQLFFTAASIQNPSVFSVIALASLRESAETLGRITYSYQYYDSQFRSAVIFVKKLYTEEDRVANMIDGSETYPNPLSKPSKGMAIDIRQVRQCNLLIRRSERSTETFLSLIQDRNLTEKRWTAYLL